MLEGGQAAIQADEDVVGAGRLRELEKRVRNLERLLGRKTMETEILKLQPTRLVLYFLQNEKALTLQELSCNMLLFSPGKRDGP